MFVCLSVRSHISETTRANFTKFSCTLGVRGRGSVLLCRRSDTICTSGFMDDVMFSQNGLYGALCLFLSGESVTAKTAAASIPTKFCSTINIVCCALEGKSVNYWSLSSNTHILLSGDDRPTCTFCAFPLTVKQVLLECTNSRDIREKYLAVSSLKKLFHSIIGLLLILSKNTFYHQL